MSVKIATPNKEDMYKVSDHTSNMDMQSTSNVKNDTVATASSTDCSTIRSQGDKHTGVLNRQNVWALKKRRSSERVGAGLRQHIRKRSFKQDKSKHPKDVIKLPTKFLLGGNINDPLNLNSMNDEEVNRLLNAQTPVSSPLPTPAHRRSVEVLIPPNINDPLNLNSGEDIDVDYLMRQRIGNKKRKKHKRKKSVVGDTNDNIITNDLTEDKQNDSTQDLSKPLTICTDETNTNTRENVSLNSRLKRVVDKIVSPAIPQNSPKPKRKRTISETSKKHDGEGVSQAKHTRNDKEHHHHRTRKQSSFSRGRKDSVKFRNKDEKFVFGNYNRYYGKRNPDKEDDRLNHFEKSWFQGKDVLDIGCNIGHITLSIAKNFEPRKIDGIDIDGNLISIARKNIKHYISMEQLAGKQIPVSLPLTHGPVATIGVVKSESNPAFPGNINFVQGNYVLERDELVDLQQEEYDVIMALSITKWFHLNFGDSGLKRCFRRMYRQLRPGGKLILEPQSFSSYKRKKNLSEQILENYQSIRFIPDMFTRYLLSEEVGFIKCDRIETPFNKAKGFQRPIYMYTKADSTYTTPHPVTESRGVTPLMNIDCGHNYTYTPAFEYSTPAFDSFTTTPSYDGVNFLADYSNAQSTSTQATPHWEAATFTSDSQIYYSNRGSPIYSGFVEGYRPGSASDFDNAAASLHDTAPSSVNSSQGHMTPGYVNPGVRMTPGHYSSEGHGTPGNCSQEEDADNVMSHDGPPDHSTSSGCLMTTRNHETSDNTIPGGRISPTDSLSSGSTCDTCSSSSSDNSCHGAAEGTILHNDSNEDTTKEPSVHVALQTPGLERDTKSDFSPQICVDSETTLDERADETERVTEAEQNTSCQEEP